MQIPCLGSWPQTAHWLGMGVGVCQKQPAVHWRLLLTSRL